MFGVLSLSTNFFLFYQNVNLSKIRNTSLVFLILYYSKLLFNTNLQVLIHVKPMWRINNQKTTNVKRKKDDVIKSLARLTKIVKRCFYFVGQLSQNSNLSIQIRSSRLPIKRRSIITISKGKCRFLTIQDVYIKNSRMNARIKLFFYNLFPL